MKFINYCLQFHYKELLKRIHSPIILFIKDKFYQMSIDDCIFIYKDENEREHDEKLFRKMNTTKVVFRKYKEGDILALFPECPEVNYTVVCYQHIGQHGSADYQQCVAISKPATENEYQDLKRELESLGYDLKVVKKAKINYLQNS